MGNYYEQGRHLIMPPPSDWEVSQDRSEEVEGIEQCLPGEDGNPSDDYQGLKRLVVDRFNSRAHFIEPNQTPTGQQANPDNRSWRAILYSTNGLAIPRQPDNLNPSPVQPLGTCRVDGEVYVYKSHPILTRFCDAQGLPFVQSTLETVSVEEAFLIGRLLEKTNDRNLYCFSQPNYRPRSNRGLFVNKENIGNADRLIEGIGRLSIAGKITPARADALVKGVNNAVRNQRMAQEQLEMGRESTKEMKNQKWFWAGLTLLPFALANERVRNAVVKSVSLAVRAIWERNARAELRSSLRRLVRGLSWVQLQRVGQNLTEKARRGELSPVVDKTTPEVAGRVEKRIGKTERAASAVVTAPAGWGKERLMETLALRNRHLEIFSTSPDSIMAGTRYRGDLEERIVDIPAEIERSIQKGTRVILFMDEAHEAFFAGRSQEETRALLERWKQPLAKGDLVIVGFTTPKEWLSVRWAANMLPETLTPQQQEWVREFEGNPKLSRNAGLRPLVKRFMTIDAPARPAEDIEAMLQDEIETRRKGAARIGFSQDAIRRMARASLSEVPGEGHIPRTAFDVFDSIVAEYEERANGIEVNVGVGEVDRVLRSDWPEIASRLEIAAGPGQVRASAGGSGVARAPVAEAPEAPSEGKGPHDPPAAGSGTAAGSGNGTSPGRSVGEAAGGHQRTSIAEWLTKGMRGFGDVAGGYLPFGLATAAEHLDLITPFEHHLFIGGTILAQARLNPLTLGHLFILWPAFETGRLVTAEATDAIGEATGLDGLRQGNLLHELIALAGSFGGAAAVTRAVGGQQVIDAATRSMIQSVARAATAVEDGVGLASRRAVAWAREVGPTLGKACGRLDSAVLRHVKGKGGPVVGAAAVVIGAAAATLAPSEAEASEVPDGRRTFAEDRPEQSSFGESLVEGALCAISFGLLCSSEAY